MADKNQDINIRLRVLNEAKSGVSAALGDLKTLERGVASVNSTLGTVGGAIGLGLGFAGITSFVHDGIDKFEKYQETAAKVDDALTAFGDHTEGARQRAASFASEVGRMAHMSGRAVLDAEALGVTIGNITGPELERVTKAAVGYSKALGIDLDTAMKKVSQAAAGNTVGLAKFGIVVNENATASEKYHAILEKGEKLFAAQTERTATFKENIDDLSRSFGGLSKSVGEVIATALGDSDGKEGILTQLRKDIDAWNAIKSKPDAKPDAPRLTGLFGVRTLWATDPPEKKDGATELVKDVGGRALYNWASNNETNRMDAGADRVIRERNQLDAATNLREFDAESARMIEAKTTQAAAARSSLSYGERVELERGNGSTTFRAAFARQEEEASAKAAGHAKLSDILRDTAAVTDKSKSTADAIVTARQELLGLQSKIADVEKFADESDKDKLDTAKAHLAVQISVYDVMVKQKRDAAREKLSDITGEKDPLVTAANAKTKQLHALMKSGDLSFADKISAGVTEFLIGTGLKIDMHLRDEAAKAKIGDKLADFFNSVEDEGSALQAKIEDKLNNFFDPIERQRPLREVSRLAAVELGPRMVGLQQSGPDPIRAAAEKQVAIATEALAVAKRTEARQEKIYAALAGTQLLKIAGQS